MGKLQQLALFGHLVHSELMSDHSNDLVDTLIDSLVAAPEVEVVNPHPPLPKGAFSYSVGLTGSLPSTIICSS